MLERPRAEDPYDKLPELPSFELVSHDIADGQAMPDKFAAFGAHAEAQNLSPHLHWSGFPSDTRSFAVSCFDPDAPTPSGFWHWTVIDIPPTVTTLESGAALPEGAVAIKSDLGAIGYHGPMPPEGDFAHRLYFVVHAVRDAKLGVEPDVTPVVVAFNLVFKSTARAKLVPTYQR